jgi:hypothetical protein
MFKLCQFFSLPLYLVATGLLFLFSSCFGFSLLFDAGTTFGSGDFFDFLFDFKTHTLNCARACGIRGLLQGAVNEVDPYNTITYSYRIQI